MHVADVFELGLESLVVLGVVREDDDSQRTSLDGLQRQVVDMSDVRAFAVHPVENVEHLLRVVMLGRLFLASGEYEQGGEEGNGQRYRNHSYLRE